MLTKFYTQFFDWIAYSREELKKIDVLCTMSECGDPVNIIGNMSVIPRTSRKMNFAGFGIILTPHIAKYLCPKCGSTRHFKYPFLRFSGYVEVPEHNTVGTNTVEILCFNPKCNLRRMSCLRHDERGAEYRCASCNDRAKVSKNTFAGIDLGGLNIKQKEYK